MQANIRTGGGAWIQGAAESALVVRIRPDNPGATTTTNTAGAFVNVQFCRRAGTTELNTNVSGQRRRQGESLAAASLEGVHASTTAHHDSRPVHLPFLLRRTLT